MNKSDLPNYETHLFVCTNASGENNCAAKGSKQLRDELKAWAKTKYGSRLRVNKSGCLGQCSRGIAAVFYPQTNWHLELVPEDIEKLKLLIDQKLPLT